MRLQPIALRILFTAFAVAGAGCVVGAILAQLGRFSLAWDVLPHFAPIWLGGSLLALVCSLGFRRAARKAWAIAALAGVVSATALMAPEYLRDAGPRAPSSAPDQIKVIQFNVLYTNLSNGLVARWLKAQQPDFVVAEEMPWEMRDAIVAATGWTELCGRCKVVIFSRWPVAPGQDADSGTLAPLADGVFATPGGPVAVVGVHDSWPIGGHHQQVQEQRLAAVLHGYPATTTLLTGDFNSTPWSFARRQRDKTFGLIRRDRALASWPTPVFFGAWTKPFPPVLPIDHIYAGSAWATVGIERGPRGLGSDHYPVIATLAPRAPR